MNALAGTWDFWLVNIQYGTDLATELGQGYLLGNRTPVTWTILSLTRTIRAGMPRRESEWGIPIDGTVKSVVHLSTRKLH